MKSNVKIEKNVIYDFNTTLQRMQIHRMFLFNYYATKEFQRSIDL